MDYIIIPLIGFSNGIIVGAGIIALIVALDIIPRLAQISKTYNKTILYEHIIIIGAIVGSVISLSDIGINLGKLIVITVGFCMGIFIGLLASALAEVINVMPVLIRRFSLKGYEIYIVFALIFGKVIGSFLNWFIFY